MSEKKRFFWIDNLKLIAIFTVVIYHLLSGLVGAGILPSGNMMTFILQTCTSYQVYLFFICSGFLYQELTKEQDARGYGKMLLKKLLALGVPYVVFSVALFAMKSIFKSSVNFDIDYNLFNGLLLGGFAPYWFLQVLFICFMLSPILKSRAGAIIRLGAAAALCVVGELIEHYSVFGVYSPLATRLAFSLFWFVFGMCVSWFGLQKRFSYAGIILLAAFFVLMYFSVFKGVSSEPLNIVMIVLSTVGLLLLVGKCSQGKSEKKPLTFLSGEIMPIFLMHTIFSAGARILLIRAGVTNAAVHIIIGFAASVILPIAADLILRKIKLDVIYYPTRLSKTNISK